MGVVDAEEDAEDKGRWRRMFRHGDPWRKKPKEEKKSEKFKMQWKKGMRAISLKTTSFCFSISVLEGRSHHLYLGVAVALCFLGGRSKEASSGFSAVIH